MQKNTQITIVVLVLLFVTLAVVLFLWRSGSEAPYSAPLVNQPVTPAPAPQDTAAAITEDVSKIDIGDLDKEFKNIDSSLNSL